MAAPNNLIILSDRGAKSLLSAKLAYLNTLDLHLYKNDFTPVHNSADGAFTEASFKGYDAQAISGFFSTATNANPPDADTNVVDFTFSYDSGMAGDAANTIYGWYVTDPGDSDHWIFAGRTNLTTPAVMDADGKTLTIPLRLTEGQLAAYP